MTSVVLHGEALRTEADLHPYLAHQLDLGDHYGQNLSALWDRLSTDVPRPVRLVWLDPARGRAQLGTALFDEVVSLLRDVEQQDLACGWTDRFEVVFSSASSCPRCGQGAVVPCRVATTDELLQVCEECEAVWSIEASPAPADSRDLGEPLHERGRPPQWAEREVLTRGTA